MKGILLARCSPRTQDVGVPRCAAMPAASTRGDGCLSEESARADSRMSRATSVRVRRASSASTVGTCSSGRVSAQARSGTQCSCTFHFGPCPAAPLFNTVRWLICSGISSRGRAFGILPPASVANAPWLFAPAYRLHAAISLASIFLGETDSGKYNANPSAPAIKY
jgi:hypothetical protein